MTASPWRRVTCPAAIPTPLTSRALAQLNDHELAELIRSHFVPHPGRRSQWQQLWELLRDDNIVERTLDVLEDFLDDVETALQEGLDETDAARAVRFHQRCNEAWNRLTRDPRQPGPVRALLHAIAVHRNANHDRTPSPADQALWDAAHTIVTGTGHATPERRTS